MQTVLLAAVAENGVIGQGGTMPWRLKSDMRHFRALTAGKPAIIHVKTDAEALTSRITLTKLREQSLERLRQQKH